MQLTFGLKVNFKRNFIFSKKQQLVKHCFENESSTMLEMVKKLSYNGPDVKPQFQKGLDTV